jgi:hypothetical protein
LIPDGAGRGGESTALQARMLRVGFSMMLEWEMSTKHWRTPPKFRSFEKAGPNSQFCGIYIYNNLIRIRVSLIYKLSETPN